MHETLVRRVEGMIDLEILGAGDIKVAENSEVVVEVRDAGDIQGAVDRYRATEGTLVEGTAAADDATVKRAAADREQTLGDLHAPVEVAGITARIAVVVAAIDASAARGVAGHADRAG